MYIKKNEIKDISMNIDYIQRIYYEFEKKYECKYKG